MTNLYIKPKIFRTRLLNNLCIGDINSYEECTQLFKQTVYIFFITCRYLYINDSNGDKKKKKTFIHCLNKQFNSLKYIIQGDYRLSADFVSVK